MLSRGALKKLGAIKIVIITLLLCQNNYCFDFVTSLVQVVVHHIIFDQEAATLIIIIETFRFFHILSLHAPIIDVSFSCVCPVIDHEFRHNIVKVAVDPRGHSRVDPQTFLTMLIRDSSSITADDALTTDTNLFFTITNCQVVRSRSLSHRIN